MLERLWRRQENSQKSLRGPDRQDYEHQIRDEEIWDQNNNRGQLEAPSSPSLNSQRHPPRQSRNMSPPSWQNDDPSERHGEYGRGGRNVEYGAQPPPRNNAQQKSSHQDLKKKVKSLRQDNKTLEEQIWKLETECGRLKNRVETMQSAQDAQESRLSRQEQDDTIHQQFNNVFQPIRNWSAKLCKDASQPINMRGLSPALTPLVQRVIPSLRSLEELPEFLPVGDKKRRRMFIRGWIALNVSFRILPGPNQQESGSDLWLSKKEREAVRSLESTFISSSEQDSQSSYHEWRALTFALLDKSFPSTEDRNTIETVNDAVRKTLELIRPMASPTANLYELERILCENVFVPAVELSQVLRRQRAHWYLRFPHMTAATAPLGDGYTFRPDQMTDVDSLEEDEDEPGQSQCFKAVDIIILPGLYKCGNNDGEQYEIESVVERAQVSCTCI